MMKSVKIVALVALALVGTLAAFHFAHRQNKHTVTEFAMGENHHVPNKVMLFAHYKQSHNLKFGAAEETTRFQTFAKNVDIITEHNKKNSSYKLGLTSLAHLTREEFASLKLGYNGAQVQILSSAPVTPVKADGEVDWTTKGAVTPVKNQAQCGSCWAFSATGALEGAYQIKNGKLESFSEQDLVDCSTRYGNQGCNGGLMDQAFEYVKANGIATEADYPYKGVDGSCNKKVKRDFKIKGLKDVTPNSNSALVAAIAQGPVSVAIEADTSAFQLYKSGVLTGDACGTQLDHGVLAVGYGSLNGVGYIKVKNSWGAGWGSKGFILVGQADGAGICGINQAASYPTL